MIRCRTSTKAVLLDNRWRADCLSGVKKGAEAPCRQGKPSSAKETVFTAHDDVVVLRTHFSGEIARNWRQHDAAQPSGSTTAARPPA